MITKRMIRVLRGISFSHVLVLVLIFGFIASAPPWAHADIPRYINYQGKLTDADDNPVTGDVSVTLRIYDAETGGTALWEETQTVTVARGIFSILLGSAQSLSDLDFDSPYWYSVEVESDGEMTPRQRLTTVAYAINADKLDGYDASQFVRTDAEGDAELSGDLTVTGGVITAGANEDIVLDPTGLGNIVMKIDSTSGDFKVTDGTTNWVLVDSETGNVTIANDLTVSGTIYGTLASAASQTSFTNITVTGASDLQGPVYNSTGALTIADTLTQSGSANQVTFAGNVDADNGLDVTGALTVSGTTTLSNGLDMNSNIDLDYSGTSAALDVNQVSTGPAAKFAGNRVIIGESEAANAYALSTGELYIQGDLEVDGTIYGDIETTGDRTFGDTTMSSLIVTGTSELRGNVDMGADLDVTGNIDLTGDLGVTGTTTLRVATITPSELTSGGTDDYTLNITQTLNDPNASGGTDVYRAIKLNLTESEVRGWDNVYLIDLQVGEASQFTVDDSGDIVTAGTLNMTGNKITNLGAPGADTDAATKSYVDSASPASGGGWTNVGSSVYLITAGDNVGIGTDSTDTYKVNISGDLNTTSLYLDGSEVTASAEELNKLDGAGANVTAANLDELTGGGATSLHTHTEAEISGVVVLAPSLAQTITAQDDVAPLILKGGGATADLLDIQDSSADSHLTVEADGDIQIDTSGIAALGSIDQSDATASVAIATDTTKLGGGAGSDSDGVLKLGINEGSYQYIWYDTDQGLDGLGAFVFSDQATIPSSSPAYLNFGMDFDSETKTFGSYYAIKMDPEPDGDATKQRFSVVNIPDPGENFADTEKTLFDVSSDGSFNIYDPAAGEAVFQIEPGGRLAHDFRNLIKNASFEAFSGFEDFIGYDPTFTDPDSYDNTTDGYRGGWADFTPDGWEWVAGKVVQHSPDLFTSGTGTYSTDFYDGKSAMSLNEYDSRGTDYTLGVPESGGTSDDGAIKQVIKGLEPDTWYSVGAAMMSTSPTTTAAILDITGDLTHSATEQPKANLTIAIGTGSISTITVNDTSDFPSGGTLLIDNELFDYIGKTATSFSGIARGVNGTTVAAHTTGTDNVKLLFKPLKSTNASFQYKKGSFKTDSSGSDVIVYLICQQEGGTSGATNTDFARFDAVQMVEGKVLPKFGPTSIVDIGDQSIYGTLTLGRSADGRGGILSVDQFVRTRGIDFFDDDPGISGTEGGGGYVGIPYSFININSGSNPGSVPMDTGGYYVKPKTRKFQVRAQGTYESPTGKVRYRYVECTDPMNDWDDASYEPWTSATWSGELDIPAVANEDLALEFGVNVRFSEAWSGSSGFKGGDQWEFKAYGIGQEQDMYDSFNTDATYRPGGARIFKDPETGELTFEDSKAGKVRLSEIVSQRSTGYISPPSRDPANAGMVIITAEGEMNTNMFSSGQTFEIGTEWVESGEPVKYWWHIKYDYNSGSSYTYYGNWMQVITKGTPLYLTDYDTSGNTGIGITFPSGETLHNYERWTFYATPGSAANVAAHHHANENDGGLLGANGTTAAVFQIAKNSTMSQDVELKFYDWDDTIDRVIKWDNATNKFNVSNDMHVSGTFTATNITGYAPDSHVHDGSDITSGTVGAQFLPTAGASTAGIIPATGLTDAMVASGASILGTKISPDFGGQNILTTGNVGVGTASPAAILDLYNQPANGSGVLNTTLIQPDYSLLNTAGDGYTTLKVNVTDAGANATGAQNLLDLQVGSASKFKVDDSGNTTIAGDLIIGTTGLSETTSAIDSGAYKIGVFDEFGNSNADTVQGVLYDLDVAISGVSSSSLNSANSTLTLSDDATDQTLTGNLGDLKIVSASDLVLLPTGSVGIGTAIPSQELHIEGDMRLTGAIYDTNNETGGDGQVLKSTGSSVDWVDVSSLPAGDAATLDSLDSTAFAILAGQAEGQSLSGGTAASENLTLDSTANSTKGYVLLAPSGGYVGIGTTTPGATLSVGNDAFKVTSVGTVTAGTWNGSVIDHERGGLKTDVSLYDGLVKISGGSTSAVTLTAAGEALLDDADNATQRLTLGLGSAATRDAEDSLTNGDNLPDGAAIQTYVTGLNYITDGNTNWDNSYGYITATDTLTGLVQSTTSGASYITGGKVGIGMDSPTADLTVKGNLSTATAGTLTVTYESDSVTTSQDLTSHFNVGDAIKIVNSEPSESSIYTVSAITSNSITLNSNYTGTSDNDGSVTAYKDSNLFLVQNGSGTAKFTVNKSGNVIATGDLEVSGDLNVSGDQIITGTTLYDAATTIRVDSANALLVEKAGADGSGADIFVVDTSTPQVNILTNLDVTGNMILSSDSTVDGVDISDFATAGNLDHTKLSNIGTNTHDQIDSHIDATSDPHGAAMSVSTSVTTPTLYGSSAASGNLTLESTADSTKGYVLIPSGSVGIGTTAPGAKLEVDGGNIVLTGTATNRLILPSNVAPATPALGFGDGNSGMYESGDNRLGFSTNGSLRWEITETGILQSNVNNSPVLFTETATATNPVYTIKDDADTGIGWAGADQLSLVAGATEMLRLVEGDTEDYIYTTAGNVGIGTTDPNAQLEIYKSNDGNLTEALRLYNPGGTANTGTKIAFGAGVSYNEKAYISGFFESGGVGQMALGVHGAEIIRLDENGYVGIGTTGPVDKLHVYEAGTGQFSGLIIQKAGSTTADEARIDFTLSSVAPTDVLPQGGRIGVIRQGSNAMSDMYFSVNDSVGTPTKRLYIKNDGTVGIGTTIPSSNLHIYQDSPTDEQTLFQIGTSADASRFAIDEDGDVTLDGTIQGLVVGTDIQAYDAGLTSIAGLTTSADKMIYTTASDTYAVTGLTAAGRALLDDADAATQQSTLGLGSAATRAAEDTLTNGSNLPDGAAIQTYVTGLGYITDDTSVAKSHLAELHPTGNGAAMTVAVAAGKVYVSGNTLLEFAGGNTGAMTPDSSDPRINLVTLNSSGSLVVYAGTPAGTPSPPAYPTDELVIAEVYIPANATSIDTTDQGQGYIYKDVRPFLNLGGSSSEGTVTSVAAGAGMNFTTIDVSNPSGSVVMGEPSTLTDATTNSASGTTHTHAITNYAVSGTANQISVSGSPKVLGSATTLSLPQNIHTAATPQFARIGLGAAADGTYLLNLNGALVHGTSTGVGIGTTTPADVLDIINASVSTHLGIGKSAGEHYDIGRDLGTGFLKFNGSQATYSGYSFFTNNGSLLERVSIDNDGSVGIGTTAPEAKLDVEGTLQVGAAGDTGVAHDLVMTNITSSTIKSYGGLTIQSGDPNDNLNLTLKGSGTGKVYIDDDLEVTGTSTFPSGLTIASGDITASSGNVSATSGAGTFGNLQLSGNTLAATNDSGVAIYDNASNGLFVEDGGQVGIGTAGPGAKLDIRNGEIYLTDDNVIHGLTGFVPTNVYGRLKSADSGGGLMFTGLSDQNSNSGILFQGVVGVDDPVDATPAIILSGLKGNSGFSNITSLGNSETVLQVKNNTTQLMTVLGDGSVGIGTTAPDQPLHVHAGTAGTVDAYTSADLVVEDDADAVIQFLSPNTDDQGLLFGDPQSNIIGQLTYKHTSDNTDYMNFYIGGDKMRIQQDGNVGIGTTDPGQELDVNGDIQLSGNQILATSGTGMRADTADGSDDQNVKLTGGGTYSVTRGAVIVLGGNEDSSYPGDLLLNAGDPAAAQVKIDGTVYVGAGNVGIGSTDTSTYKLNVNGTGYLADNLSLAATKTVDGVDIGVALPQACYIQMAPEFPTAVLSADDSDNSGTMTADFDAEKYRNYYNWTTTQGSTQDYDIVLRVLVPEDFNSWDDTAAISFYNLVDSSPGASGVRITVYDTSNSQVYISGATIQNSSDWTATNLTSGNIAGTYAPGSYMTIRFKLLADDSKNIKLGDVTLKYKRKGI